MLGAPAFASATNIAPSTLKVNVA